MAGTGFYTTGTGAQIAGPGIDWASPTNIQTQSDTPSTSALTGGQSTDRIRATNFDFSNLASTDTVIGITVIFMVGLTVGADNDGGLTQVQLWDGSNNLGDDQISGTTNLLAAYTLLTYGGSSNLWGASAPSISTVQGSGFGVNISGAQVANTPTLAIRWVRMAIHTANTRNRRQIGARGRMR